MKLNKSLLAMAAILAASSAHAGVEGHQLAGSLTTTGYPTINLFDPQYGLATPGASNTSGTTVTASDSALDFGLTSSAGHIYADFKNDHLLIEVQATSGSTGTSAWTMSFTSVDPGLFMGISQVSSTFGHAITSSLSGNTLTLTYAGGDELEPTYRADFAITAVPEPASVALMLGGLGLVGVAAARRRKSV